MECSGDAADAKLPYAQTRLYRLLDQHQNTIRIHVNVPTPGMHAGASLVLVSTPGQENGSKPQTLSHVPFLESLFSGVPTLDDWLCGHACTLIVELLVSM